MESKDFSCFSRKTCEVQRVAEDISEANKIECCEFEARWRICNNKLNKETTMIPEAHISVFQTEDTISDQMLNFSLNGITCEDKFNGVKVDELDTTANTQCFFTEKSNGDDTLLPFPSQNWSYFESFINENKEEFLDLCTISDFSTNLLSEEGSDSFLFDESTLNSDVCSLKIRYESFQDNIKDKTNVHDHQDDAQLQFFPSNCCTGMKKGEETLLKKTASAQEEKREHDNPEHHTLCQLESKSCLLSGAFMDDWKDAESSLDSVCSSSVLNEDQGNWKLLKKSADRYSNQTNYTLRAKRQIRYNDDYLYDIDSLDTIKTLGKIDQTTDTAKEDDDDWCPRKRKKTGKKEPPVIIKYIIVNRFKGHKNMHVKISRLDCTEQQVLLTDEIVKKYKKLSPLKEFWSPVPKCNKYNQEKSDGKLKICSDAGTSYMFFASKNKKQRTLANGTSSVKIGHSLNHQKNSVIETVDSNTEVPKNVQKYDKSVYEFTDEIELKRITIRTVSKPGWLRDMQQEDSLQKLKKQNILSRKRRTTAQDGKETSDRNYLEKPDENSQVLNADVHKVQGEWNSASDSLGNCNTTNMHSSIVRNKIETSRELLSLDPASSPGCPVLSVYSIHSAPEILGGCFRSLLDGDDFAVNENFQISPQDSSTGQQFNEDVTANPFSSRQRQINISTRCSSGESDILKLEVEPNIHEACNLETIQNVHHHRVMNEELYSTGEVSSENDKTKNQLNINKSANQCGLKMYSCQNEINANFTQKVSEETKQLFTSKDTLRILDISSFTPGKAKPTCSSEFSKGCTAEIPSNVIKSNANSLQQCSQNQFAKKATFLNECSEQFQIHSEVFSTTIKSQSEPTSVSFSPRAQSSNQLQTFDHVSSMNYKYPKVNKTSKVNKTINNFRKRHGKSNAKQWDRRTIQKYRYHNNEIKPTKIEKDSILPESYIGLEYFSDTLYANQKKQPKSTCKSTKGFTNKDLEMCTKLVKKGLMSARNKLSIKEEKLNAKAKCWIAPAESYGS
ncbi:uncharacterized protein [Mobula birostris]|uniref:uncharacterized protein isoform X2 n=1 Tax=Mobula birostris TaxID=1983395 RepID=UPI003B27C178